MKKIGLILSILILIGIQLLSVLRIDSMKNILDYEVNIRQACSSNSEIIDTFKKNDVYEVIKIYDKWACINYKGTTKYVYRIDLIISKIRILNSNITFPVNIKYNIIQDIFFTNQFKLFGISIPKVVLHIILFSLLLVSIIFLLKSSKPRSMEDVIGKIINNEIKKTLKNKRSNIKKINNEESSLSKLDNNHYEENSNEIKGRDFEEYIINKMNDNFYTFVSWTSDKITKNGKYSNANKLPDLEYEVKETGTIFYIECKYRKNENIFIDYKQVARYRRFSDKMNNINVFIAIGTGGTSKEPENLYLIPISETKNTVNLNEIKDKFKKINIHKGLYFDEGRNLLV